MRRSFFTLHLLLLLFTVPVQAQHSGDFDISQAKLVEVNIDDQASDGCWSNLGEARTYAEDKLKIAGANVGETDYTDADERIYDLRVVVVAERLPNGLCTGMLEVELRAWVRVHDDYIVATPVGNAGWVANAQNMNSEILNYISEAISQLSPKQD